MVIWPLIVAIMTLRCLHAFGVIYCNQVKTFICNLLPLILRPNDGREPK